MTVVRRRFQLGSGAMLYFLVTGLTLGGAVFTQANLLFWAFGLMVGGIVCSAVLAIGLMLRIRVQRLVPMHGVVDEAMTLRYQVTNGKRWLPAFNLMIREVWDKQPTAGAKDPDITGTHLSGPAASLGSAPHAWVMHLGPKQTQQVEAPCWPRCRGLLTLESIAIASSFPFGLFRWTLWIKQRDQLIVYPALFRMRRAIVGRLTVAEPTGLLRHQRPGGSEEFFGLRPYRAGDSQRMIDWKHSARTGQLISREMTQGSPPRIMLLLDLTQPETSNGDEQIDAGMVEASPESESSSNVERAISFAASLICDAYLNGYPMGLVVARSNCEVFSIHHSLPHRAHMLEALARLDTSQEANAPEALPAEPNVMIHAWEKSGSNHQIHTHLTVAEMGNYVIETVGDSSALLVHHTKEARGHKSQAPTVKVHHMDTPNLH